MNNNEQKFQQDEQYQQTLNAFLKQCNIFSNSKTNMQMRFKISETGMATVLFWHIHIGTFSWVTTETLFLMITWGHKRVVQWGPERESEWYQAESAAAVFWQGKHTGPRAHIELPLPSYIMSQVQHSWLFKAAGSVTKSDIHSTSNSASKTPLRLYWGQTDPCGLILVQLLIFIEKLIMLPHVSLAVTWWVSSNTHCPVVCLILLHLFFSLNLLNDFI